MKALVQRTSMNFSTRNDAAANGKIVNTCVELLLSYSDPLPKLPWRVRTMVDSSPLYCSHHAIRSDAERKADEMHKVYLSIHGGLA